MNSSSSSSSESTVSSPAKLSPSLSQYNFDPFAVHPFTSYASSNPNFGNAQTMNHNSNPCRQPLGVYPTPYAPILTRPTTIPIPTSPTTIPILSNQQSPPKSYAYMSPRPTGIFVPFRQETSSPELSDILKPKSNSPSDTSKTRPINTASFIPVVPSGSQKH